MEYKMSWKDEWKDLGMDLDRCTCLNCDSKDNCQYAYDIYNVDGDCIMEK